MHKVAFVMCFSLIATAAANGGYNYQQPRPVVNQNFRASAPFANSAASAVAPSFAQQYNANVGGQYVQQQFAAPAQLYAQPSPQFANTQSQYIAPAQQQTIVSKTIYIHSAPEETEEINSEQQNGEPEPARKNYRIVFIKAPSHNIRFNVNSMRQAQAANEEKTIIYVLSKKPDISQIQNQLATAQTEQKVSKPEVYFIKYKTQAEANRAQQEIQAQYDALGGSTSISDEGIAPVTSVIGGSSGNVNSAASNFGSNNFEQSATNVQQNFASAVPASRYLPAKNK